MQNVVSGGQLQAELPRNSQKLFSLSLFSLWKFISLIDYEWEQGLFESLLDDNVTRQLSLSYRLGVEAAASDRVTASGQPLDQALMDQVSSANVVRLALDSHSLFAQGYSLERLNFLGQV